MYWDPYDAGFLQGALILGTMSGTLQESRDPMRTWRSGMELQGWHKYVMTLNGIIANYSETANRVLEEKKDMHTTTPEIMLGR